VVGSEHFTDDTLDGSTLAKIQRGVIKKNKQNVVSRLFHAKSDKDTIAGWKSDLSKTLLVFNVSSVVVTWLPLTFHSQTELALNTHTIVSGMDHNVTMIHAIVSNIDNTVMKIQEGTDGKNLPVSIIHTLFTTGRTLTVA
jgi:hypothetical protein